MPFRLGSNRVLRIAKEGGWIVAGQGVTMLGSLVLVRVLTEYLDPEQYGQLALGLTVAALVNQVVTGGITAGIGRFYTIAVEGGDLYGYLHAAHRLLKYATLAVAVIAAAIVIGLAIQGWLPWVGLVLAALSLSIVGAYNASFSSIQNAARERGIVAFHGALDSWLRIAIAVGMMYLFGISSEAVVAGYLLSSVIVTLSQSAFMRRFGLEKKNENSIIDQNDWIRKIWSYSLPFSLWGGFTWAQLASDRWALQLYGSAEDVGMYAVVFQIGYTPMNIASGMAMTYLAPILYQRSGNSGSASRKESVHRLGWRLTIASLAVTLAVFALTLLIHDWLFGQLVSATYRSAAHLLPWVVLAGGIFAAGQILALKLMSEMKSSSMTIVKIVTALIGIALNVFGAVRLGAQGVVIALVTSSLVYFISMAWLARLLPEPAEH